MNGGEPNVKMGDELSGPTEALRQMTVDGD